MSDSNIKIGVSWADFPPGSSYVFKDQYTKLTNQVGNQVSAINAAQNGLQELSGKVDSQGNKINEELANASQNIEQLGQNVGTISNNQDEIKKELGKTVKNTDYATLTVGGVVLLSEKINQLTPITLTASPAAYDQADDQANRTAIQTAINGIITSINDLIVKQQAAKQMEQ